MNEVLSQEEYGLTVQENEENDIIEECRDDAKAFAKEFKTFHDPELEKMSLDQLYARKQELDGIDGEGNESADGLIGQAEIVYIEKFDAFNARVKSLPDDKRPNKDEVAKQWKGVDDAFKQYENYMNEYQEVLVQIEKKWLEAAVQERGELRSHLDDLDAYYQELSSKDPKFTETTSKQQLKAQLEQELKEVIDEIGNLRIEQEKVRVQMMEINTAVIGLKELGMRYDRNAALLSKVKKWDYVFLDTRKITTAVQKELKTDIAARQAKIKELEGKLNTSKIEEKLEQWRKGGWRVTGGEWQGGGGMSQRQMSRKTACMRGKCRRFWGRREFGRVY